jgi:hypothetical protein
MYKRQADLLTNGHQHAEGPTHTPVAIGRRQNQQLSRPASCRCSPAAIRLWEPQGGLLGAKSQSRRFDAPIVMPNPLNRPRRCSLWKVKSAQEQVFPPMEPAGIEPATSCLQSRSDCPLVSRSVAQMPANTAFLLATRGHERTARDKLVPPWCPLGVRDLGRREEGGPRLPGCVSSRMRPRPRPLLRRR